MNISFHGTTCILQFPNTPYRLEEDPDDPEKTPTLMIQKNLQIFEEMKAEFENMKLRI